MEKQEWWVPRFTDTHLCGHLMSCYGYFSLSPKKGLTISLNSTCLIMRTTDTCFLPNQQILTKSNLPKANTSLSTVCSHKPFCFEGKKKKRNIQFAPCKGIRILESWKVLLVESEIREKFACGIWNTAQRIRNPTSDWNPESRFHWQRVESSTCNPESVTWNCHRFPYMGRCSWYHVYVPSSTVNGIRWIVGVNFRLFWR